MRGIAVFDDLDALSARAAWHFVRGAAEAELDGTSFNVALSGGRTPRELYRLLADETAPFRAAIPWKRVHFFWTDERRVPRGHPESNFRMARETLLDRVPVPEANLHPMPASAPDLKAAARAYESVLRRRVGGGGKTPCLDLVFLGMGADGHTASLFPGSGALAERRALVAQVSADGQRSARLTLTLPALNAAARVVFLVAGEDKAAAAAEVLARKGGLPASRVRPEHGELYWLLDKAAASNLPKRAYS
jgi:6-phosphogluconolactonase